MNQKNAFTVPEKLSAKTDLLKEFNCTNVTAVVSSFYEDLGLTMLFFGRNIQPANKRTLN
jgi:hypothetical protein